MRAEVVNPNTLSVTDMMENMAELYFLHVEDNLAKPILTPMGVGSLELLKGDSLLMRVIPGEIEEDCGISEEPAQKTTTRRREILTYKFNGADASNNIFVEFRPTTGDIRVNFRDKDSAKAYFDYFREQFYTSTTGASVITVSNIYKDLNLVNWNSEDCDDWGWYTLDNGTCRYITDVLKTKNSKLFGFTLKRPTKLYETKKREE